MSVHIALIGRTAEPVLTGYRHYGSIDSLYLLHSPDTGEFKFRVKAQEVKDRLRGIGFNNVILKQIDAFDMYSIINTILSIVEKEERPIFINITGGTNLMAGAACAASFFVGAKAYYVLGKTGSEPSESKVIELPVPNIPYNRVINKTQLRILAAIRKSETPISATHIRWELDISPQSLSYQLKELAKKRLITVSRGYSSNAGPKAIKKKDNRMLTVELSNAGKLVLAWTGLRE